MLCIHCHLRDPAPIGLFSSRKMIHRFGVKINRHNPDSPFIPINHVRGVVDLRTDIEARACEIAGYIIENHATVRSAARRFGISKSTVHKDLSERLEHINRSLYLQVKEILTVNKAERHIRGGMATRRKYRGG